MYAARRRVKATDAVIEPGRIDECMLVRTGHLDPAVLVGNPMAARDTHESALVAIASIRHLLG